MLELGGSIFQTNDFTLIKIDLSLSVIPYKNYNEEYRNASNMAGHYYNTEHTICSGELLPYFNTAHDLTKGFNIIIQAPSSSKTTRSLKSFSIILGDLDFSSIDRSQFWLCECVLVKVDSSFPFMVPETFDEDHKRSMQINHYNIVPHRENSFEELNACQLKAKEPTTRFKAAFSTSHKAAREAMFGVFLLGASQEEFYIKEDDVPEVIIKLLPVKPRYYGVTYRATRDPVMRKIADSSVITPELECYTKVNTNGRLNLDEDHERLENSNLSDVSPEGLPNWLSGTETGEMETGEMGIGTWQSEFPDLVCSTCGAREAQYRIRW